MIVYLLRHGNAEDFARGGDAARVLTEDGVARLERASSGWRRVLGPIDRVLSSPLLRAVQTAEILRRAAEVGDATVETTDLVPHASPHEALDRLQQEALAGRRGVACVGHEPHLGALLGLLLTGQERCALPLKKGMLVAVELDGTSSMLGRLRFALGQKVAGAL